VAALALVTEIVLALVQRQVTPAGREGRRPWVGWMPRR
jgi:hypothetical protein